MSLDQGAINSPQEPEPRAIHFTEMSETTRRLLAAVIAVEKDQAVLDDPLVPSDAGKDIRFRDDAVEIVVPSTETLGEDFICALTALTDPVTITPDSGVTIRGNGGTIAQYQTVTIRAIGEDEYLLSPNLT